MVYELVYEPNRCVSDHTHYIVLNITLLHVFLLSIWYVQISFIDKCVFSFRFVSLCAVFQQSELHKIVYIKRMTNDIITRMSSVYSKVWAFEIDSSNMSQKCVLFLEMAKRLQNVMAKIGLP